MKLLSRLLVATAITSSISFAGLVNGVSVIINKEPITLYEIYKYSEHFKISKKEALDILVRQKLEDAEIKKMGIDADIFEVDAYIENLAKQNNMSEFDFLKMLKDQNVKIDEYKEDLKTKLKRDKLYKNIIQEKVGQIGEEDLKEFYNAHKEEFAIVNEFVGTIFASSDENALKAIQQNPMLRPEGVNIQDATLSGEQINNTFQVMLAQTPVGKYTPIQNVNNQFVMLFVKEKNGVSYIPFEKIKNNIYGVVYKQKEQKALEDYFEKLKSSANIQVLRNPN